MARTRGLLRHLGLHHSLCTQTRWISSNPLRDLPAQAHHSTRSAIPGSTRHHYRTGLRIYRRGTSRRAIPPVSASGPAPSWLPECLLRLPLAESGFLDSRRRAAVLPSPGAFVSVDRIRQCARQKRHLGTPGGLCAAVPQSSVRLPLAHPVSDGHLHVPISECTADSSDLFRNTPRSCHRCGVRLRADHRIGRAGDGMPHIAGSDEPCVPISNSSGAFPIRSIYSTCRSVGQ